MGLALFLGFHCLFSLFLRHSYLAIWFWGRVCKGYNNHLLLPLCWSDCPSAVWELVDLGWWLVRSVCLAPLFFQRMIITKVTWSWLDVCSLNQRTEIRTGRNMLGFYNSPDRTRLKYRSGHSIETAWERNQN